MAGIPSDVAPCLTYRPAIADHAVCAQWISTETLTKFTDLTKDEQVVRPGLTPGQVRPQPRQETYA